MTVTTNSLRLEGTIPGGNISLYDKDGKLLLQENATEFQQVPNTPLKNTTYSVTQVGDWAILMVPLAGDVFDSPFNCVLSFSPKYPLPPCEGLAASFLIVGVRSICTLVLVL